MGIRRKTTPAVIVAVPQVISVLIALVVLLSALNQPWLGLQLSEAGGRDGIRIVGVVPQGPAAALPVGAVLAALSDDRGRRFDLMPFDATEDPDTAPSYAVFDDFFLRQDKIADILRAEQVTLTLADGRAFDVTPESSRPLGSLPFDFWMLIFIGMAGIAMGASILGLKRDVAAVRIWAMGTVTLLFSTFPAALFVSRELALPGDLFRFLSAVNFLGSFGFCVLIFAVFLVYPRRLASPPVIAAVLALIPGWCAFEYFHVGLPGPTLGHYLPIAIAASAASIAAVVQYLMARGDPLMRAAVGWFGLSIALTTSIFVALFVGPSVLGHPPSLPQWTAYALGLIVHSGLALGVTRYRLFDLEPWAFRIVFYAIGTAAFALLDVLFVTVVALDALPAFGLALTATVFLYLPLRTALQDRVSPEPKHNLLFRQVIDVALATTRADRDGRWTTLLRRAFNPLTLEPAKPTDRPEIEEEGLALLVPGAGVVSPLRLRYAHAGRRLFSRRQVELAGELCDMLAYASESRIAYERGIAEERSRIARDMHDNIGAKLLSALHGTVHERKDAMIREALSELRDIVNNATGTAQTVE